MAALRGMPAFWAYQTFNMTVSRVSSRFAGRFVLDVSILRRAFDFWQLGRSTCPLREIGCFF